jgi:hypothetical protein
MWDSSLRQLDERQEITHGRLVGVALPVERTDFVAVEPFLAAATLISRPSRILALQQCACLASRIALVLAMFKSLGAITSKDCFALGARARED